jgi:hypothetical protein
MGKVERLEIDDNGVNKIFGHHRNNVDPKATIPYAEYCDRNLPVVIDREIAKRFVQSMIFD